MEIVLNDESMMTNEPEQRIHILRHGLPLCRFTNRIPFPGYWPEGHFWVSEADAKTMLDRICDSCKKAMLSEGAAKSDGISAPVAPSKAARKSRLSARNFSRLVTDEEFEANDRARRHQFQEVRTANEDKVLRYIRRVDEAYSVEAAGVLRCSSHSAASVLRRLEIEGFLVSRLEPSPKSGLGRRYYKLTDQGRERALDSLQKRS